MLNADDLRVLCQRLRSGDLAADDDLVDRIRSEVDRYRESLAVRGSRPPGPLAELLPLMGWLIYEASLVALVRIPPAFDLLPAGQREAVQAHYRRIELLADTARRLPWPEYAPRAIGALRAQALAESKRDTEAGYDNAWIIHTEARERAASLRESLPDDEHSGLLLIALDETYVQLALAEIGTACRTGERIICRWSEGLQRREWTPSEEARWVQRIFRDLSDSMSVGETALKIVERLDQEHQLVHAVDEYRMALVTGRRNPAIMTARAALMLLALSFEMEVYGRSPAASHTWPDYRKSLLASFRNAYRLIELPVRRADGEPFPLARDHLRSLVQLRLTAAILAPGLTLPSALGDPSCLAEDPLNDDAAGHLSAWLAETVNGRRNGDANVIGSATMPAFIRSVDECRASFGVIGGYRDWRKEWTVLDRYAVEPDRPAAVDRIL